MGFNSRFKGLRDEGRGVEEENSLECREIIHCLRCCILLSLTELEVSTLHPKSISPFCSCWEWVPPHSSPWWAGPYGQILRLEFLLWNFMWWQLLTTLFSHRRFAEVREFGVPLVCRWCAFACYQQIAHSVHNHRGLLYTLGSLF